MKYIACLICLLQTEVLAVHMTHLINNTHFKVFALRETKFHEIFETILPARIYTYTPTYTNPS